MEDAWDGAKFICSLLSRNSSSEAQSAAVLLSREPSAGTSMHRAGLSTTRIPFRSVPFLWQGQGLQPSLCSVGLASSARGWKSLEIIPSEKQTELYEAEPVVWGRQLAATPTRLCFHCSDLGESCKAPAVWGAGRGARRGNLGRGAPNTKLGCFGPVFSGISLFSEGPEPAATSSQALRLRLQVVFDKRFVRLSKGAHGWGSERRRDGEETAALFRALLERLLGGYCSRFAESEASPSCSPETQLLGENNHRAEHRAPSRKEGRKPQNKREKCETIKEAPSRTHGSSPPHRGLRLRLRNRAEFGCFPTSVG